MVDVTVVCYSDVCYTGICYRDGSHVVFIGSHSHHFAALHLSSGDVIWRVQLGGRIEGSACLSKCARFVMVGSYDGCLYVLEALTGDIYWQFQTGAEVKSSPCVDPTNGHVYFGSHDHCLHALDVLKQTVMWRLELGGSVFSSPCVSLVPHCVYAATLGGSLSAVSPLHGTSLWRCMLGKPLFSSPVAIELGVIIGCVDGAIYCVGHLGQKLWQHQTEAPVFSSPCASFSKSLHSGANQFIVFGSHDNHIYCIDGNGGLQWKLKVDSPVYSTPFVFPFNISQHALGQRETPILTQGSTHQTEFCHRQNSLKGSASVDTNKSKLSGSLIGRTALENNRQKCLTRDRETVSTGIREKHDCAHLVAACSTRGRLYIVTLTSGRVMASYQFPGETFSSPVVLASDTGFDVIVGCRDDFVYCLKYKRLSELIQT
ncbi:hypothetical protein NP493_365g02003 [Ridgeia piscesae]|uniref:Pyrrolo-quinoline quinone repeat domain-containing protein n=1 Tax=Ridgeia piscesae TaxID=27915 RepID=A0AAD9L3W3_RIDPI|nr:hypothetical protein NP493_365g02003 [Ridgeia piscesae]